MKKPLKLLNKNVSVGIKQSLRLQYTAVYFSHSVAVV